MKAPETGIYYDIDYDEYNEWEAVRHSNLFILEEGTLAHYKYTIDHPEEFDTSSYLVGHAGHTALLEPQKFQDRYAVRPAIYENDKGETKPWSGNSKVCKAIMAELKSSGKDILKQDEWDLAIAIAEACMAKESVLFLIENGKMEVSIIWNDQKTGMKCKGRIDLLVGNVICDLKTTAFPATVRRFGSAAAKYGYPSQLAFYRQGLLQINEKEPKLPILIAAEKAMVEKIGSDAVSVYQVRQEDIGIGDSQNDFFMSQIKDASDSGEWPGYSDNEVIDLVLPGWYGQALNPA